jgi:hypothetical protein
VELTPYIYNSAEARALEHLPNRLIEAAKAVAFGAEGYPVKVDDLSSLHRYAEVMHELRMPQILQFLRGGLRTNEIASFQKIVSATAEMTENVFGRRRVPHASLLDAIHIKRHIDYLYPDRRPAVLEIGPGSGYVGALLVASDHPYTSTDIAQAFYLYQHYLLRQLSRGGLSERVCSDAAAADSIIHMPWWKFYTIDGEREFSAEVITANHCLCEMHPTASAYVMHLIADLLDRSPLGALVFFSMGSQILRSATQTLKTMYRFGLQIAHHDNEITVVIGPKHPSYCHSLGIDFTRLADSTEIPRFVSDNEIGQAITRGREAIERSISLPIEGIRENLRSVLGLSDLRTDDAKFLEFAAVP